MNICYMFLGLLLLLRCKKISNEYSTRVGGNSGLLLNAENNSNYNIQDDYINGIGKDIVDTCEKQDTSFLEKLLSDNAFIIDKLESFINEGLKISIDNDNLNIVKLLIKFGANVNFNGLKNRNSFLILAINDSKFSIAEVLINSEANILKENSLNESPLNLLCDLDSRSELNEKLEEMLDLLILILEKLNLLDIAKEIKVAYIQKAFLIALKELESGPNLFIETLEKYKIELLQDLEIEMKEREEKRRKFENGEIESFDLDKHKIYDQWNAISILGNDYDEVATVLKNYFIFSLGAIQDRKSITVNKFFIDAIRNGYNNLVEELLAAEMVDVNLKNAEGDTALITAFKKRNHLIATKLLSSNVDINIQNSEGNTALMTAIINSDNTPEDNNLIKYLLKKDGLDVNLKNNNGNTASILALKFDKIKALEMLVETNKVDYNIQNEEGDTLLMIAIKLSYETVSEVLIELDNVDMNLYNEKGDTALTLAIKSSSSEMAKKIILLEDINYNSQNKEGDTAITLAIKLLREDIVDSLLRINEIDYNKRDNNGDTAFTLALRFSNERVITFILNVLDIDYNNINNQGNTPLIIATELSLDNVINFLITIDNLDCNNINNNGDTALMISIRASNEDLANFLMSKPNIDYNNINKDGDTALTLAIKKSMNSIVDLLTKIDDIDYSNTNIDGDTPLTSALKSSNENLANFLTSKSNINYNSINKDGDTALMIAVRLSYENVVASLLKKEADPNIENGNKTALTIAYDIIKNHSQYILDSDDESSKYYFNQAKLRMEKAKNIFRCLCENTNLNINKQNMHGETLLILAIKASNLDLVRYLTNIDKINLNVVDNQGYKALDIATNTILELDQNINQIKSEIEINKSKRTRKLDEDEIDKDFEEIIKKIKNKENDLRIAKENRYNAFEIERILK